LCIFPVAGIGILTISILNKSCQGGGIHLLLLFKNRKAEKSTCHTPYVYSNTLPDAYKIMGWADSSEQTYEIKIKCIIIIGLHMGTRYLYNKVLHLRGRLFDVKPGIFEMNDPAPSKHNWRVNLPSIIKLQYK